MRVSELLIDVLKIKMQRMLRSEKINFNF